MFVQTKPSLDCFESPSSFGKPQMRLAKLWHSIKWSQCKSSFSDVKIWHRLWPLVSKDENDGKSLNIVSKHDHLFRCHKSICAPGHEKTALIKPSLNCYVNYLTIHLPGYTLPDDAQAVTQIYVWYTTIAQTRIGNVCAFNLKPAHEVREHIGGMRRPQHGDGGPRKCSLSCQVWISLFFKVITLVLNYP